MSLRTATRRWLRGSIFHIKARVAPKHVENSNRGDKRAKRAGKRGTDLDILITKDGRVVNTHWPRPLLRDGFRDPHGRIAKMARVRDLTWVQVSRLRAGRWPRRYRIRSIEAALAHCAKLGLVAVLEPKGDPRFKSAAVWEHIAEVAEDVGCAVSVRALPENADALPYAKAAGFRTWVI